MRWTNGNGYPVFAHIVLTLLPASSVREVGVEPTRLTAAGFKPAVSTIPSTLVWYHPRESNPDASRPRVLNPLRLPIPPRW